EETTRGREPDEGVPGRPLSDFSEELHSTRGEGEHRRTRSGATDPGLAAAPKDEPLTPGKKATADGSDHGESEWPEVCEGPLTAMPVRSEHCEESRNGTAQRADAEMALDGDLVGRLERGEPEYEKQKEADEGRPHARVTVVAHSRPRPSAARRRLISSWARR